MSRIDERFRSCRAAGRKALITFVTAGDPEPGATVPLLHALVEGGADVLELGVPFSDPMADGPIIQRASERALRHHVNLKAVLRMVAGFRTRDQVTPVVLMGYLNPIERMGYEAFATAAAAAGVDGVLTVDLPPDEGVEFVAALRARGLQAIFLFAPTTSAVRARQICDLAGGFVYYVSLKGVTGAATLDVTDVGARVAAIRDLTDLPIGVGFGIRDPETAARVAQVADAVVVGSALVAAVERLQQDAARIPDELRRYTGALRTAMDAAPATGSSCP
jgi:tryptophan synthase alpha chain